MLKPFSIYSNKNKIIWKEFIILKMITAVFSYLFILMEIPLNAQIFEFNILLKNQDSNQPYLMADLKSNYLLLF